MSAPDGRALIEGASPLLEPFWAAARDHRLVVQRCTACGDQRFPPLVLCPACWSEDQEWVGIEPVGTLWSYVVYHRALDPAFRGDVPYAVGRVVTDAGPVFEARLDIPVDRIRIGMTVVGTFHDFEDGVSLPRFTEA